MVAVNILLHAMAELSEMESECVFHAGDIGGCMLCRLWVYRGNFSNFVAEDMARR